MGHADIQTTQRYITLAMGSLRRRLSQFGLLCSLITTVPAVPLAREPARGELSEEVTGFPLEIGGARARLFVTWYRMKYHTSLVRPG